MTDHERGHQQWGDCQSGELCELACRLRTQYLRQCGVKFALFGALGLVVVVVAGIVMGGMMHRGRGPQVVRQISCQQCVAQFDAYWRHLIHERRMDAALAEQMRVHLARCAGCRNAFEKRYPGVRIAITTAAARVLVGINRWPVATATELLAGDCP